MNRKRKGNDRLSQGTRKKFFKSDTSHPLYEAEFSSITTTPTPSSREWQRCGDGFSIAPTKKQSSCVDLQELPKRFGQKWIQPEALLVSNQCPSSSVAVHEPDNPNTFSDDVIGEICCNSSDSDSNVGSHPKVTHRPVKKPRCVRNKGKTLPAVKRLSAKCVRNEDELNSVESDPGDIVSVSDSDSNDPDKDAGRQSSQVSRESSPVHDIECVGSPAPQGPYSSESESDVQDKGKNRKTLQSSPMLGKAPDGGTPSISSCASSQTTQDGDISPGKCGLHASEWAKHVDWETTPTKQQATSPNDQADSAKKKKKYKKGGLADQLLRIISRDKSASRMWIHQQTASEGISQGASGKCVMVSVVKVNYRCSLHVTQCTILDGSGDTGITGGQCIVLFPKSASRTHSTVAPSSVVRIFPPWQQLDTHDGKEKILLCTRYQLVGTPISPSKDSHQHSDAPDKVVVSSLSSSLRAKWMCPCSTDVQMMTDRCPAHLFPVIPASVVQSSAGVKTNVPSAGKTLFTVTCNDRASRRVLTFDTLLESIEKSHTWDKMLPSFQATVLRVFQERVEDSEEIRHQLLVEDSQGTVALVMGVEDSLTRLGQDLEGRCCCFSRLQVHSRTNRDKDPAMFSAIEAAWCGNMKAAQSQESGGVSHSDDSQAQSQHNLQPPAFCYVLAANETISEALSGMETVHADLSQPVNPPPIMLQTIASVKQSSHQSSRVSLVCKVIYSRQCTDGNTLSGTNSYLSTAELFVADHSLHVEDSGPSPASLLCNDHANPLAHASSGTVNSTGDCMHKVVKVSVRPGCVTAGIKQTWDNVDTVPYVVLLRDMWIVADSWIVDKYSLIVSLDESTVMSRTAAGRLDGRVLESVRNSQLSLPPVSATTPANSLVCITGVIRRVDEKLAFSWDECDGCGSDQLGTKSSTGALVCMSCRREVAAPVQRMKMEVVVVSDSDSSITVKISLQQSTIQRILPEEADEEGYDVDIVLNKKLGPLNCILTSSVQLSDSVQMTARELIV